MKTVPYSSSFFTRLESRVKRIDSLLCIGLDPHPDQVGDAKSAKAFCLRLIEATAPVAAAFKPNLAFFEALGPSGMKALKEIISAVPGGVPVILDGKRGDIPSTARAYALAAFHAYRADAVTVSPYLGSDSLEPFLHDPEKGVFLLCKTSNPGAADLQDLLVSSSQVISTQGKQLTLYERVALMAVELNLKNNLGLVVGATQPDALSRVREIAPHLWILAPGVGAQGADLYAALQGGMDKDGYGLLIPVSRGISAAEDPWRAAEAMRLAINDARTEILKLSDRSGTYAGMSQEKTRLADQLLEAGCIKFGEFTLKSGLQSPIYFDLRMLAGYPRLLDEVAKAYLSILHKLKFDRLAGIPYAGLPVATAISLLGDKPMVYARREIKEYGTRSGVEGVFNTGETVVVIDDLATTGGSKFEAIQRLTSAGLRVRDVVVLIDRQSGARESLAKAGYRLHVVFTLSDLLDYWEAQGRIEPERISATREFLKRSKADIVESEDR